MNHSTKNNKNDHFHALVQNNPAGLGIIDRKGKILFASLSSENILGYSSEYLTGKNVFSFIDDKCSQGSMEQLIELIKKPEDTGVIQCRAKHKNGSLVWLEITGTNLLNDPNIKGVIVNYQDITNRIESENKRAFLAESMTALASELDFRAAIKKLANFAIPKIADFCIIDTITESGHVDRVVVRHGDSEKNKRAQSIMRIPRQYVQGSNLCTTKALLSKKSVIYDISEEDSEVYKIYNEDICEKGVCDPAKLEALASMGLQSLTVVPIKSRGNVLGAIAFGSAKKHNKGINITIDLDFMEELAHRAGAALENAKLYRQVQNSSKLKDEFLASLAHELRNPLAPMIHSLDLLRIELDKREDIAEKEELDFSIDSIGKNVQNMCRLLDDLLDVSRITKGRVKLQREVADVIATIKRSIETSNPVINEREHVLHVDLPLDSIYIEADHMRLEQVFVNLLNNAAKYTPKGGNVWISCRLEGREVIVSVKDDGKGLTPQALSRIFDLFSQENKDLERSEQEGLGIGLKLAEAYTEMQGGKISATSGGPGMGSEFVVRFPVRRGIDIHNAPESKKSYNLKYDRRKSDKESELVAEELIKTDDRTNSIYSSKTNSAQENKILLVDDNEDAVKSLNKLLARMGYSVETAFRGTEALDMIKESPPKLVLLDIGLPEMNGYKVAKKIREITKDSSNRIVLAALTGYGQKEDKLLAKRAGFDYHITKPVSIVDLQAVLRKELG
ncbi:MAG: ATP-binding protein [Candidatus Spechtbacterales bacterium]